MKNKNQKKNKKILQWATFINKKCSIKLAGNIAKVKSNNKLSWSSFWNKEHWSRVYRLNRRETQKEVIQNCLLKWDKYANRSKQEI